VKVKTARVPEVKVSHLAIMVAEQIWDRDSIDLHCSDTTASLNPSKDSLVKEI
jgi:hypothetical protein